MGVVNVNGWIFPEIFINIPPPNPFVVLPEHDDKCMFVDVNVPPLIATNSPPPLPFAPEQEQDSHVTFIRWDGRDGRLGLREKLEVGGEEEDGLGIMEKAVVGSRSGKGEFGGWRERRDRT